MGSRFSRSSNDCGICRSDISPTGDRQRYSPGCCEKWYHHGCLENLVNGGVVLCPNCRTNLPHNFLTTIPPNAIIAQALPVHNNRRIQSTGSGNSKSEPLHPEESVLPWTPPTASSLQSSLEHSNIKIECTPEIAEVSLEAKNSFHVLVTMSCSESELAVAETQPSAPTEDLSKNYASPIVATPVSTITRPPLDIICVLDTSGSMSSDSKLKNLLFAVDYIRGELSEFDRMAVITFENSAVVIHNLLRMTDENKSYTSSLCAGLRPGGGTSILSGLQAAMDIISGRMSSNPITSVFLLTDGVDGSHVSEKKKVAQGIKESGASLFVYGFGSDHDSKHLRMIADAATGTFTYIEKSDMVIDAFGGALGAEQSIFATNICLTIHTGPSSASESSGIDSNGVMITSTESGSYRHEIHPSGSYTKVYFNNIMLGEERDVLVSMVLPGCTSLARANQTILHTSVTFTPIGSDQASSRSGEECIIARVPVEELSTSSVQRNERVDVQVNRMLFVAATKESLNFADSGDYNKAREVVEKAMKEISGSSSMAKQNIKTKTFVDELNSTLANVRDRDVYQSKGGRAVLSQQNQDYGLQRQAYAREGIEGVYQNKCSKSSQAKANYKKSGF